MKALSLSLAFSLISAASVISGCSAPTEDEAPVAAGAVGTASAPRVYKPDQITRATLAQLSSSGQFSGISVSRNNRTYNFAIELLKDAGTRKTYDVFAYSPGEVREAEPCGKLIEIKEIKTDRLPKAFLLAGCLDVGAFVWQEGTGNYIADGSETLEISGLGEGGGKALLKKGTVVLETYTLDGRDNGYHFSPQRESESCGFVPSTQMAASNASPTLSFRRNECGFASTWQQRK